MLFARKWSGAPDSFQSLVGFAHPIARQAAHAVGYFDSWSRDERHIWVLGVEFAGARGRVSYLWAVVQTPKRNEFAPDELRQLEVVDKTRGASLGIFQSSFVNAGDDARGVLARTHAVDHFSGPAEQFRLDDAGDDVAAAAAMMR
jgi:hypothetical protein